MQIFKDVNSPVWRTRARLTDDKLNGIHPVCRRRLIDAPCAKDKDTRALLIYIYYLFIIKSINNSEFKVIDVAKLKATFE